MQVGLPPESCTAFCSSATASLVHVFFEVGLAKLIVCECKIRIHFDRLAALLYRFVIRMRKHKKLCQIGVNDERQGIQAFRFSHFRDSFVIPTQ